MDTFYDKNDLQTVLIGDHAYPSAVYIYIYIYIYIELVQIVSR